MDTSILKVNNVSFSYEKGNEVIKDISFTVPEKSVTMLIGPNGSGKSTLLKMMVGLLEPTSGSVTVFGDRPKNKRKDVGYVPQKLYFDQTFPITVEEFLRFYNGNSGRGVEAISKSLSIQKLSKSPIGTLSGGQLQRVLVARSLLGEPKILFLDEPLHGIDVGGERDFYELIKDIHQERNVTVIMVSHEIHIVNKIADRVVCINKEMLCSGEPNKALLPDVVEKLYGEDVSLYKHKC